MAAFGGGINEALSPGATLTEVCSCAIHHAALPGGNARPAGRSIDSAPAAAYPMLNGSCLHLGSEHLGGSHLQTEEIFVRQRGQRLPPDPPPNRRIGPQWPSTAVPTRGLPKLNEEEH
jgi:hypothetical protein